MNNISGLSSLTYNEPVPNKQEELAFIRERLSLSQKTPVLWESLDKARLLSHAKARQNGFLQKLVTGGFCNTEFYKYLVNLLVVHEALEEAQTMLSDSLKVFVHSQLFRSEGIKKDLIIWKTLASKEYPPCEAALQFAKYIRETAIHDPEKIIAIMYTLYGTILSGGQTNKKVVETQLKQVKEYMDNIPEGSGVALYELHEDIGLFKLKWHVTLCRVPIENHEKLQNEVIKTFETVIHIIETAVEQGHC